ncbi:DUF3918 family protein [Cytobacillus purgationiresistens]|uniref:DUF3918 domain-containing protein n=1 Tax=Cytobacillus purgationiresistens TaxID=863449 RepID=A0ABU0AE85_9BACI|nr:DUF3918 family protein [Cytobacillus purgationiresistens]MDQ0269558.1 hypothetical protein [Cytobacillus purgationiresistens]
MNKMITSAAVIGAGIAAYGIAQKNNLISKKDIKKFQKRVNKLF